jgi:hypothetical protein
VSIDQSSERMRRLNWHHCVAEGVELLATEAQPVG